MSKNVANDRADFCHGCQKHCHTVPLSVGRLSLLGHHGGVCLGREREKAGGRAESAHAFLGMHIVTFATVFGLRLPLPRGRGSRQR